MAREHQGAPGRSVAKNEPADAVDACFATNGSLLATGDGVWSGILDDGPDGASTNVFPLNSSSRIVSGGPIEGSVFECRRQPVKRGLRRGVYGAWQATDAEVPRLQEIFPDRRLRLLSKPDAGLPPELRRRRRRPRFAPRRRTPASAALPAPTLNPKNSQTRRPGVSRDGNGCFVSWMRDETGVPWWRWRLNLAS